MARSIPLLAIFVGLISVCFGAYVEDLARYDLYPMAIVAYYDHPEYCVKDNFKNSSFVRQYLIQCDYFKGDNCSGFTAIAYSDKAIILSFRGSINDQLITEIYDEAFQNRTAFVGGGTVNVYFQQAFLDIWNSGMKDDFFTVKNGNPGFELWITGHSLGAAIASISAGYIAAMGYFSGDQIKLITYGQPRVGDGAYADYIDKTIPYAYRVVHKADIVPHLPPIWSEIGYLTNYTHHKNEIWYPNDMKVGQTYVECDVNESDQCSDMLEAYPFGLSIPDHDDYWSLREDFGVNGCPNYNPNGARSNRHKFMVKQ